MIAHPINQSADGHQLDELSLPFPFRVDFSFDFLENVHSSKKLRKQKKCQLNSMNSVKLTLLWYIVSVVFVDSFPEKGV